LLYTFEYSAVYPIVGGIWIVLALLATRAGLRMERQDKEEAIASTIAS
jgi:hypothetical protein